MHDDYRDHYRGDDDDFEEYDNEEHPLAQSRAYDRDRDRDRDRDDQPDRQAGESPSTETRGRDVLDRDQDVEERGTDVIDRSHDTVTRGTDVIDTGSRSHTVERGADALNDKSDDDEDWEWTSDDDLGDDDDGLGR